MADYLLRAIGADGRIRAFVAASTQLVNEARRRHDTWPTATIALGRALTATAMLGATLKEADESVTLRIAGNGPLGGIICDSDVDARVRGYVHNPHVDPDRKNGRFNVAGAVGTGYLHVTRQLAVEGIYTGTAEIVSGEIAEDVTYYLTQSEQTPSAVGLGVRVNASGYVIGAGGYMIQLLPDTEDEHRRQLENNLQVMGAVSSAVEAGASPHEILASILSGIDYRVLESRDLRFACRCSRGKALSALALMDAHELEQMIYVDQGAEVRCHFCAEVYRFSQQELQAVSSEKR